MDKEEYKLFIDIGNTNVHIAYSIKDKIFNYSQIYINGELKDAFSILLERLLNDEQTNIKAYVSSVNSNALNEVWDVLEEFKIKALVISPILIKDYAEKNNLEISNYSFIGSDLFCDIIAAKVDEKPVIIIDGGTCLKVLGVDSNGIFLGGSIMPGKRLMLSSLNQNADMLNVSETFIPVKSLMLSTDGAVSSGITYGYGSMCLGLINKINEDYPEMKDAKVIVTGGDSYYIKESLNKLGFNDFDIDSKLTLKGVAKAFRKEIDFN